MAEREEFEKFSVEVLKFRIDDKGDTYVKGTNDRDWKIWQAAKASSAKHIAELDAQIVMLRNGDTCARFCEGTAYRHEAQQGARRVVGCTHGLAEMPFALLAHRWS